jgi:hypothetical protein
VSRDGDPRGEGREAERACCARAGDGVCFACLLEGMLSAGRTAEGAGERRGDGHGGAGEGR